MCSKKFPSYTTNIFLSNAPQKIRQCALKRKYLAWVLESRSYITVQKLENNKTKQNKNKTKPVVTHVWNLSLFTHTLLGSWKMANVNPFPKVDMPLEDSDYRGIIAIPVVTRLFKKVMYRAQAQSVIEKNLSRTQFAYKKEGNCTNALLTAQHQANV